jgi:tannase
MFSAIGELIYAPFQIAAEPLNSTTEYSNTTGPCDVDIPSIGGEFIRRLAELVDLDKLSSLDNCTYDTIPDWVNIGLFRYMDSLRPNIPNFTESIT